MIRQALMTARNLVSRQREVIAVASLKPPPPPPSKTWTARYFDLVRILGRWGSVSPLYYAQAMHRPDVKAGSFIPYRAFRSMRNERNLSAADASAQIRLLRDKAAFHDFFAPTGLPVVQTLGQFHDAPIAEVANRLRSEILADNGDSEASGAVFLKPNGGIKGQGNFIMRIRRDGYDASTGATVAEAGVLAGDWLAQPVLRQHARLSLLHPASINTLRIITYRGQEDEIHIFIAYLRAGTGGHVVDNASAGGIVIPVNLETGRSDGDALELDNEYAYAITCHPTTGFGFRDVHVPDIRFARETAVRAHRLLPAVHTVGWDLAFTETGPVLLEGNDDWGAVSVMWLMPDFRKRFHRLLAGLPPSIH